MRNIYLPVSRLAPQPDRSLRRSGSAALVVTCRLYAYSEARPMPLATNVPTAAPNKNDFVSVAMLKHTSAKGLGALNNIYTHVN